MAHVEARGGALWLGRTTPDWATAPFTFPRVRVCCLSLRRLGGLPPPPPPPPTPGTEAFAGLFAGDEHPPLGIPTPSLPFLPCETEHPNPKLFGYLMPTNFQLFAKSVGSTCVRPC
jgi:hypothetical protein